MTTIIEELRYWLALIKAPQLPCRKMLELIETFQPLSKLFNQDDGEIKKYRLSAETMEYLRCPDWHRVDIDLKWLEKSSDHHIITILDDEYPYLLKQIDFPPLLLFIAGEVKCLNNHQVAIVGSRNPTRAGEENAFQFAFQLTEGGFTITSGLALGIDAAAHKGALKANKTIAVIGAGINIIYPKSNQKLAEKIVEKGAIISEFSLDTPPLPAHFPQRNRIISGLSLGTLVVEAALKSGSLITARYAADQGREVYAIPGSIHNHYARGCHFLIREGAKLVEGVEDIFEDLGSHNGKNYLVSIKSGRVLQNKLDENHSKLLECVGYEATSINMLVERSHFPVHIVSAILTELELQGFVYCTLGGYTRVPQ